MPRVKRKAFASARAHAAMLADRTRTDAYRQAIFRNVRPRDVVLDLGCGSGVLAFFAAQAGSRRVHAVDSSPVLPLAKSLASANGLDGAVTFHSADIFRFKMRPKADVIVHEQIGEFLWNEGLLAKTAHARRHLLKPGGKMLPWAVDLWAAPVDHRTKEERGLAAWGTARYGLNFRPLAAALMREYADVLAHPRTVALADQTSFLAPAQAIHRTDLTRNGAVPRELRARFRIKGNAVVRGVVAYFRVWLDKTHGFDTGPARVNTHWGQIFVPAPTETPVRRGARLDLSLFPSEDPRRWRIAFRVH